MKLLMRKVATLALALAVVLLGSQSVQVCSAAEFDRQAPHNVTFEVEKMVYQGGHTLGVHAFITVTGAFGYLQEYGVTVPINVGAARSYYYDATSCRAIMINSSSGTTGIINAEWWVFNSYYYVCGTIDIWKNMRDNTGDASWTMNDQLYVSSIVDSLPSWQ